MGKTIDVKVDTATCQRNLNLYLQETSKETIDAINFKLYDGGREAVRQTPKANKSEIKSSLNAVSSKYPGRSVVEILVAVNQRAIGITEFDMDEEVQKFVEQRTSHIAFAKSGWLPGIKKLLTLVHRSFVSISGVSALGYGGAEPASKSGSQFMGSIFNDVKGTGNFNTVEKVKEIGGDAAVQKINSDVVTYLSKKLDIPAEKFNRS